MGEKSIKEIMEETFGVNRIPMRKVSRDEMDELIKQAKERGKTKKKLAGNEKKEEVGDNEKESTENFPCPKCGNTQWNILPNDGRYYCLKCGEVIQPPCIDADRKEKVTDSNKTPEPVSHCDQVEKKVDQINPINEQITETDKELLYCEYRCNDCQEIVVACGNSLEKAKKHIAFHKECGGRLIFLRQVNSKVAGNKERFSHPRVERAICNGCSDDMGRCPRTFKRMVACLLNNMDYKMKWIRGD